MKAIPFPYWGAGFLFALTKSQHWARCKGWMITAKTFPLLLQKNTSLEPSVRIPLGQNRFFWLWTAPFTKCYAASLVWRKPHTIWLLFISCQRRRARCGYSSHFWEERILFNHCVSWHKHRVRSETLKNSRLYLPLDRDLSDRSAERSNSSVMKRLKGSAPRLVYCSLKKGPSSHITNPRSVIPTQGHSFLGRLHFGSSILSLDLF